MKVKLSEIVNARQALQKMMTKELPIKTAYRLSKLVNAVNDELGNFEDQRKKLVEKYGEKKGEEVVVPKDKAQDFQKDMQELLDVEVKIDFDPISLSDIGEISLSPVDITLLDSFIKE